MLMLYSIMLYRQRKTEREKVCVSECERELKREMERLTWCIKSSKGKSLPVKTKPGRLLLNTHTQNIHIQ